MKLASAILTLAFIAVVLWWQEYEIANVALGTVCIFFIFSAFAYSPEWVKRLIGSPVVDNNHARATYYLVAIVGIAWYSLALPGLGLLGSMIAMGTVITFARVAGLLAFGRRIDRDPQ